MENTYDPLKKTLEAQGKTFSQENLNNLAKEQGVIGYTGTDVQNKDLYGKINAGIKPIALDNLNVPKINLPVTQPITPTIAQPNLASTILEQTKVEDTANQKEANNLSTLIANLTPKLEGQSQALADAQKTQGIETLNKNLTDINNQILMKTAEINQDDIKLMQSLQNIEDKPVAMEFITGEQQSVQRNAQLARALKNSEIGILNARAIGVQGNMQLANETAKQAVELKFAPQREAIATYKAQLEALQPLLSGDEKKQAREQELRTSLALKEIDNKQKQETTIQEMLVNASSQGAPSDLVSRAQKAKTSGEAAMILGQYAGNYYQTELLKSQIASQRANTVESYSKTFKDNGGSFASVQPGQLNKEMGVTIEDFKRGISGVESEGSGGYLAVGPAITSGQYKGDKALGKYQVMGNNLSSWLKQAGLPNMTAQQFLNSSDAQEKVFENQSETAYAKYGNWDDVASVWFSGKPLAGNKASDGYNTVPEYITKMRNKMGVNANTGANSFQELSGVDLAKFNALPQVKDASNAVPFRQALSDYKKSIETYGTGETFGAGSGVMNEAYQRLTGAVKDYYKLGTLDNGVEKLIAIGIPKPSILGLKANRVAGLESAIAAIDTDVLNKFDQIDATKYKNSKEYQEIKNQYLKTSGKNQTETPNTNVEPEPNIWQQTQGITNKKIQGASIINNTNEDGTFNFVIPTTK